VPRSVGGRRQSRRPSPGSSARRFSSRRRLPWLLHLPSTFARFSRVSRRLRAPNGAAGARHPCGHAARDLATETAPADPALQRRTSRARAASRWKHRRRKRLPWRSLVPRRSTLARKESVRRLARRRARRRAQPLDCVWRNPLRKRNSRGRSGVKRPQATGAGNAGGSRAPVPEAVVGAWAMHTKNPHRRRE